MEVLGIGMSCGLGSTFLKTNEKYSEGKPCYKFNESFLSPSFDPLLCAFTDFDLVSTLTNRAEILVEQAITDFCKNWVMNESEGVGKSVKLYLCLPEEDHDGGINSEDLLQLSKLINTIIRVKIRTTLTWEINETLVFPLGQSSVGKAIEQAQNTTDLNPTLVVVFDSYCDRQRLNSLNDNNFFFSDANQYGFTPGECAGVILIKKSPQNSNSKLKILSVGTDIEKITERVEKETIFQGLSSACFQALDKIGNNFADSPITQWFSDWNNSRYRATELAFAQQRLNPNYTAKNLEVIHPFLKFGDCGASNSFIALAIASYQKLNSQSSQLSIITSSSTVSGSRCAILCS